MIKLESLGIKYTNCVLGLISWSQSKVNNKFSIGCTFIDIEKLATGLSFKAFAYYFPWTIVQTTDVVIPFSGTIRIERTKYMLLCICTIISFGWFMIYYPWLLILALHLEILRLCHFGILWIVVRFTMFWVIPIWPIWI